MHLRVEKSSTVPSERPTKKQFVLKPSCSTSLTCTQLSPAPICKSSWSEARGRGRGLSLSYERAA